MEKDDYEDWLAASDAMEIKRKLQLIDAACYAQPADKRIVGQRNREYNKLRNDQLMLLGENIFARDENLIKQTKEFLKKGKKILV